MSPKESVDLVIEPHWVLPIAPINTALTDHAVAVTAGRIVAIAPTEQVNARFEPRERVVRSDHALLPGFVNAHTRAATTLLRGLPVYGPRQRWMRETVLPVARGCMSPGFVREGTQLAIAEMLQAGITAFADMYLFPEEAARAAAAARIRAAIGLPVTDGPTVWAESATGHLAKAEQLWDEYHSHPGISLYFAPHSAFGEGDETLARVRRVADELDARVAMYLGPGEVHESQTLGRSPLVRLEELGLLGPGFTAIHLGGGFGPGLDLAEEELEIAARTGICVVACQQAQLRLGGALCPIAAFEARSVAVGLGTDSAVGVGALDMLAEARVAALLGASGDWGGRIGPRSGLGAHVGLDTHGGLGSHGGGGAHVGGGAHRGGAHAGGGAHVGGGAHAGGAWSAGLDAVRDAGGGFGGGNRLSVSAVPDYGALGAEAVLRLATLGGACALGLGAEVGSIEIGKAADLICIDLSGLACQPPRRPAEAVVFGATRHQVSDVWTSGRAAVRDGRLLTLDEQELRALARRWAERIATGVTV